MGSLADRIGTSQSKEAGTEELVGKYPSWHITQLTPEAAEKHDRMIYKAPEPIQLGWIPCTYRATFGAVAQFACHTEDQLNRELRHRGLEIDGWTEWRDGVRGTKSISS